MSLRSLPTAWSTQLTDRLQTPWRSQTQKTDSNSGSSPTGNTTPIQQPSPKSNVVWQWLHKGPVAVTTPSPKAAESNSADVSMAIEGPSLEPHYDRMLNLSSPEPAAGGSKEASIDSFLREFSTERYSLPTELIVTPPETQGRRPESPVGKSRSRPMTPNLERNIDFGGLSLTPEPVLGQPGARNFDDPPPYNADWGNNSSFPTGESTQTALSTTTQGLSSWFQNISGNVSGNRASFHSLDELQPPSYPSLAVEAPERHTWAGDSKDESIWNKFIDNPGVSEVPVHLRRAEMENLASSKVQRLLVGASIAANNARPRRTQSVRRRPSIEEDDDVLNMLEHPSPPSPAFGRPRRDTGAWWLQGEGRRSKTPPADPNVLPEPEEGESSKNQPSSSIAGEVVAQEQSKRAGPSLKGKEPEDLPPVASAVSQDIEGVRTFIDHTPIASTGEDDVPTELNVDPMLYESSVEGLSSQPLWDAQNSSRICTLCDADLRCQEGEAPDVWYLKLKNHFQVAHGNWAARMLDFYDSSSMLQLTDTLMTDLPIDEPSEDNDSPQDGSKSGSPTGGNDTNALPRIPEPEKKPEADLTKEHECPVPSCSESFDIFQDLNLHMFERHGIRGSPLGISRPRSARSNMFSESLGFKKRSSDHECIAFRCNRWFSTAEARDLHMESEHGIDRRDTVADPGFSDKMILDDFDIPSKTEEVEQSSSFKVDSKPSVTESLSSPEIAQLWQGFSASIKMNGDIQPESVGSMTTVHQQTSAMTGELNLNASKPASLGEEDKMFNRTLSELLKVVRQTSGSGSMIPHDEAFDVQAWLQGHLDTIGSDAAGLLISSSPTYYENIPIEPDAAEWVQKIRDGLDKMKPRKSRKGKERAVEYQTQDGPSTIVAEPDTLAESYLLIRSPQAEEASRIKLAAMNNKFLIAAQKAYEKLIAGTQRPNASREFKEFVESLGGVNDIINVGMEVVDMILAEEVPKSLKKVYCFLHVAYAISQVESSPEKANDFEFRAGLSVFRHCLPAIASIPGMPSERDIFDEIAHVMWEELEFALKWIEKWDGNEALNKVGCPVNEVEGLKMFMRSHCISDEEGVPTELTIDPKLLSLCGPYEPAPPVANTTEQLSTWEDIVGCGIFAIVVRFLKELKETGVIFAYLCGGLCTSLASSFKKRVKFKDRITEISEQSASDQLEAHLQQDVVANLNSYKYTGVENITNSAISMLRQGYINTIREFENYLISLSRVRRRTESEFSAMVHSIAWHSNSCATFVPDNLWPHCKGFGEEDYSLEYVDEKVKREVGWFTGRPVEQETTVNQVSISDNAPAVFQHLEEDSMDIDPALIQSVNVSMCSIDTLLHPSTPQKLISQGSSPANTTASSSSPANYDSLWENSPRGIQGSETSYSNPNSNNVTPDEVYVNPNMPNANFATDYFSYTRPVPRQIVEEARETGPKKSRKRKYLEGDGATSFPARRRKVIAAGKRLYCDVPGCEEFASTSSNLSRHKRTKHGNAAVREASYHCESEGCDRVFYGSRGKGNLRTHMKKDHGC
ncbi:hypothetical protein ABW19_dt0207150 [Dactylella cylindrospora]|nr:hypothetical protein ABW19_dt0207150 [Dactylella cylindrospora]